MGGLRRPRLVERPVRGTVDESAEHLQTLTKTICRLRAARIGGGRRSTFCRSGSGSRRCTDSNSPTQLLPSPTGLMSRHGFRQRREVRSITGQSSELAGLGLRHNETFCTGAHRNGPKRTEEGEVKTGGKQNGPERR